MQPRVLPGASFVHGRGLSGDNFLRAQRGTKSKIALANDTQWRINEKARMRASESILATLNEVMIHRQTNHHFAIEDNKSEAKISRTRRRQDQKIIGNECYDAGYKTTNTH